MAVSGDRGGGLAGRGRAATRAAMAATAGGGELPQTAAVMGGVLDALLQRTLSSMAGGLVDVHVCVLCVFAMCFVYRTGHLIRNRVIRG